MNRQFSCVILALLAIALIAGGCADKSASVHPTVRGDRDLVMPDQIIIHDFAVTPEEVKLVQGMKHPSAAAGGSRAQTPEEIEVGHTVAHKLSQYLMENLRSYGIVANLEGGRMTPSKKTAQLHGLFIPTDENAGANGTSIGFHLGGTTLATKVQVFQDGALVAEANSVTPSDLKSGTLDSLEADAKRIATAIAEEIRQAYVNRGWL